MPHRACGHTRPAQDTAHFSLETCCTTGMIGHDWLWSSCCSLAPPDSHTTECCRRRLPLKQANTTAEDTSGGRLRAPRHRCGYCGACERVSVPQPLRPSTLVLRCDSPLCRYRRAAAMWLGMMAAYQSIRPVAPRRLSTGRRPWPRDACWWVLG